MNTFAKKAIGTSLIVGIPVITALALTTDALAQFIDTGGNIIADGIVTEASDDYVTVATSGSEPITFAINNRTVVNGDDRQVEVGDGIRAIGHRQGQALTASVLQLSFNDNVGYGRPGHPAMSLSGTVVSKTANGFTIETRNATTTYTVNDRTLFVGGSLSSMDPGDRVQVIGIDTGSNFTARVVLIGR